LIPKTAFALLGPLLEDRTVQINGAGGYRQPLEQVPMGTLLNQPQSAHISNLEATEKLTGRPRCWQPLHLDQPQRPWVTAQNIEIIYALTAKDQIPNDSQQINAFAETTFTFFDLNFLVRLTVCVTVNEHLLFLNAIVSETKLLFVAFGLKIERRVFLNHKELTVPGTAQSQKRTT